MSLDWQVLVVFSLAIALRIWVLFVDPACEDPDSAVLVSTGGRALSSPARRWSGGECADRESPQLSIPVR